MCPQLACCPLNTHPGPTVIHTLQPSRVLSTLLRVTLSFLRSPSLSLCFILLLVFTPVVILVPSPFLSSSQGLLATLQQHQAPDIEMSRLSVSQTDIEKGEKDIKRHSRARGSDNKGGRRMSEAKGTRDSCCRLKPSDELKPLWFLAACMLHEAAPSVCGGKKNKKPKQKNTALH